MSARLRLSAFLLAVAAAAPPAAAMTLDTCAYYGGQIHRANLTLENNTNVGITVEIRNEFNPPLGAVPGAGAFAARPRGPYFQSLVMPALSTYTFRWVLPPGKNYVRLIPDHPQLQARSAQFEVAVYDAREGNCARRYPIVVTDRTFGQYAIGTSPFERETDRPGMDYRHQAGVGSPELCRGLCDGEPRCRAFTWVRSGVQGPLPVCWLKGAVPPAQPDKCCVSGVVR